MFLGALLDLGLPIDGLRAALGSLAIEYGSVSAERVLRAGVSATKFRVHERRRRRSRQLREAWPRRRPRPCASPAAWSWTRPPRESWPRSRDESGHAPDHEPHHSLKEIAGFVERSALSREGKDRAIHLFHRLGEAEAAIHDVPIEQIHLHEVGALDSIIDIVGVVYGMDWLGADRIVASPLNVGSGTVKCAHGIFPGAGAGDGAAAAGRPGLRRRVAAELVTPTGALLVTDYARCLRAAADDARRVDRLRRRRPGFPGEPQRAASSSSATRTRARRPIG